MHAATIAAEGESSEGTKTPPSYRRTFERGHEKTLPSDIRTARPTSRPRRAHHEHPTPVF
jgi:hypothetical protein